MNSILIDLIPNKNVGFGNQIYMLAHSLSYAIENKIQFIFISKFLNQINTDEYSIISEIIDMELTNKYLEKYNIQIADSNNFDFKLLEIKYGYSNYFIDIFDKMKDFITDKNLEISKSFSFEEISNNLINMYKKYAIPINKKLCKIVLTFSLDNKKTSMLFDLENNYLQKDIIINLNKIPTYTFGVECDTSEFYDIRTNLVFNKKFSFGAEQFLINNNINLKGKINCIHLRLEDDAIKSWAVQSKLDNFEFKNNVEKKYISYILEYIKKDDTTIILSSNYNNKVIDFLKKNNYNFLMTPKLSNYRDISAIYDYHIAQHCNNIFIGVFESSFTYLILFKIHKKIFKFLQLYYSQK